LQNALQVFFCLSFVVGFFWGVLNVDWPGGALSGIDQTLEASCTDNWGAQSIILAGVLKGWWCKRWLECLCQKHWHELPLLGVSGPLYGPTVAAPVCPPKAAARGVERAVVGSKKQRERESNYPLLLGEEI